MWRSTIFSAHKHPKVNAWLARHPRFSFHFAPDLVFLGATRSKAGLPD